MECSSNQVWFKKGIDECTHTQTQTQTHILLTFAFKVFLMKIYSVLLI